MCHLANILMWSLVQEHSDKSLSPFFTSRKFPFHGNENPIFPAHSFQDLGSVERQPEMSCGLAQREAEKRRASFSPAWVMFFSQSLLKKNSAFNQLPMLLFVFLISFPYLWVKPLQGGIADIKRR